MKVRILKNFEPILTINKIAMDKMKEYIDQSKLEIGWLGCAERTKEGYCIDDVFLFEQEVHSTTTEITTEGLNNFAMELMSEENGLEKWNNMRVWGHSHVNMTTSPSSQDEKQMDLFIENPNDFFIRIIGNKKGSFKIDIWDFELGLIYEDMNYTISYEKEVEEQVSILNKQIKILQEKLKNLLIPNQDLKKEIEKEIKSKVSEKTYTNKYKNYSTSYSNWYTKSSKKKENQSVIVENKAQEVYDALTEEEKYTLMENIEYGGTSIDLLSGYDLSLYESYELDSLIEEYFMSKDKQECFNEWGEWY